MKPNGNFLHAGCLCGFGIPRECGRSPHRLVAEIGCLQRFHKERRPHPELGKAFQKKTQTLFLSADGAQHHGLGDRGQCGIFKITADAEFGVDRDAHFDRFSGIHALWPLKFSGGSAGAACLTLAALRAAQAEAATVT